MLRFADAGMADPSQVDAIRAGLSPARLEARGQLPSTRGGPVHDNKTDVWVVMDGANVRGAVVLGRKRQRA